MRITRHLIIGHSERSRGCNAADGVRAARLSIPLHNAQVPSRDVSTSLDMTARLTISALFVDVVGRLRCGSQERALSAFLIERFHRYRTSNFGRLPLLRLDRDRFWDRLDWDRLSNLWN